AALRRRICLMPRQENLCRCRLLNCYEASSFYFPRNQSDLKKWQQGLADIALLHRRIVKELPID
ncbi:MAG TPA: hypothetical protein VK747_18145, partial [Blastocatellia bacterium]|nr:hypothetical protein [Blastocatellia bacterium]